MRDCSDILFTDHWTRSCASFTAKIFSSFEFWNEWNLEKAPEGDVIWFLNKVVENPPRALYSLRVVVPVRGHWSVRCESHQMSELERISSSPSKSFNSTFKVPETLQNPLKEVVQKWICRDALQWKWAVCQRRSRSLQKYQQQREQREFTPSESLFEGRRSPSAATSSTFKMNLSDRRTLAVSYPQIGTFIYVKSI